LELMDEMGRTSGVELGRRARDVVIGDIAELNRTLV
jgi:hypothetical protein